MSTYTDIFDGVVVWTNRPLMTTAIDVAIRQAVRAAHRAGVFYRDLVSVPVTGLSTSAAVQQIDLSAIAPDYRQVYSIVPTNNTDFKIDAIQADDLFDYDRLPRTNVAYGIGNHLMVRLDTPVEDYTLTYLRRPTVDPIASLSDWIAENHQDLIILWASATILTLVGEQEIKTRVEGLAKMAYDDLVSEALELFAR